MSEPPRRTMRTPRYTRNVRSWLVRLVSLVLTMMLGGGSAVASICDALCSDDVASTNPGMSTAAGATHHHSGPNDASAATMTHASEHQHDVSPHHPEPSAEITASLTSLACANDCCTFLSRPRLSRAADRADSRLLPALGVSALSAGVLENFDRQSSRSSRGSPPGATSARTLVVLRI
jgi:hypothetical protein